MLVFGAIAPHGGDIIAEIADDPATMARTRLAMLELGRRCALAQPETVIIADPHGIIMEGVITIGATKIAGGIMDGQNGRQVEAVFDNDEEMVAALAREMEQQRVPFGRLIDEQNPDAVLPLQWGTIVPLWFTAHPMQPRPKIVVLGPDRHLPREVLVRSGVAIARAASASGKRVAFIASCDLGHAHDPEGPYGYDPASAEHDAAFCAAVAEHDLGRLLDWPDSFLETAKVDAYWQTLMLAGALGHTPMRGELLSYEAPTYFGMAVAAYEPQT